MIKEKSCGAVVFKIVDGSVYLLIEKMVQGHYSIPKGHVEGKETEEKTALREIREETSLNVLLDTRFRKTISYSPYKDCMKDVIFFVAKALTLDAIPQEEEVNEILWLTPSEATKKLTFQTDKDVINEAVIYINDNYNK